MYPNIEVLELVSSLDLNDLESRSDVECLSSIRFPRLTSLGLQEFNLQDGSFLPSVTFTIIFKSAISSFIKNFSPFQLISKCPKLERIYMDGAISKFSSFLLYLEIFLPEALKLRDFR